MQKLLEEFNQLQSDLESDPDFCHQNPNEDGFQDGDCPSSDSF